MKEHAEPQAPPEVVPVEALVEVAVDDGSDNKTYE
jgi:hypothetical protein